MRQHHHHGGRMFSLLCIVLCFMLMWANFIQFHNGVLCDNAVELALSPDASTTIVHSWIHEKHGYWTLIERTCGIILVTMSTYHISNVRHLSESWTIPLMGRSKTLVVGAPYHTSKGEPRQSVNKLILVSWSYIWGIVGDSWPSERDHAPGSNHT